MTEDAEEQVKSAYEGYSRMALQAMVDYINGNPEVDRMWVYTDMGHEKISTMPFFRYRGGFYNHADINDADPSREYDPWELISNFDRESQLSLVDACRAAGAVPERIITTYDPHTGELESQWDYEGVKISEDDTYGRALDRWIRSMGGKPIYARE